MSFSYESQGTNSYLVYELKESEKLDSVSLGMITHNQIPGLAQTIFTQINNNKYIKYNITSKVTLKQFFNGIVNKRRLVGVFTGIVEGIISADDYMIENNSLILDSEYIFVDVSTCSATLICLPIISDNKVDCNMVQFFKEIMFNTQFDSNENAEHIARIFNFLNAKRAFSIYNFKDLLKSIDNATGMGTDISSGTSRTAVHSANNTDSRIQNTQGSQNAQHNNGTTVIAGSVVQTINGKITPDGVLSADNIPHSIKNDSGNSRSVNPPKSSETSNVSTPPKKQKSGFFGLFSSQPKKSAKEQKVKPANDTGVNPGFAIPGMPASAPITQNSVASEKKAVVNKQTHNVSTNNPQSYNAVSQNNGSSSSGYTQYQGANSTYTTVTSAPMNFGETTVLGSGAYGETTVLNANIQQIAKEPYLIRVSNQEKIKINKPVFRIGKEKSYVDYFIGDNTAISRSHANIIIRDEKYYIIDTNSTNHTFVNSSIIQCNIEVEIKDGDAIRLANEEFEFRLL